MKDFVTGTIVSRNLSVHQEHELLLKLEKAGLDDKIAQRVIDSKGNAIAERVVRIIRNGDYKMTATQENARKIMGKNYLGIEEVVGCYGFDPSRYSLFQYNMILK